MGKDKKEVRLTLIYEWLEKNYLDYGRLRHNVVTDRVQVADNMEKGRWRDVTDVELNSMIISCAEDLGRNIVKTEFETVLLSDRIPRVHPLRAYILSLPAYNKLDEPDWIRMKAKEVTLLHPEQEERFYLCLRKWLMGMVACWMEDDKSNHQVLVLIGPQGIYKTTWLERLLPECLRMYQNKLVLNGMGKVDDDVRNMLYENALINMDELDAMGSNEVNQVKSLITSQEVNNRGKYKRFKQRHVRIASFCGSTNKTLFLTDLTGSRRWFPFEVTNIVSPYDNTFFPLDRMYAQIYDLYQSGEPYWLTAEEMAVMEEHNEEYRVQESEEDLLNLWFRLPEAGKEEFMTIAEISDFLVTTGGIKNPMHVKLLSALLKKMGYKQERRYLNGSRPRGFMVYRRSEEEVKRLKENIQKDAESEQLDQIDQMPTLF